MLVFTLFVAVGPGGLTTQLRILQPDSSKGLRRNVLFRTQNPCGYALGVVGKRDVSLKTPAGETSGGLLTKGFLLLSTQGGTALKELCPTE